MAQPIHTWATMLANIDLMEHCARRPSSSGSKDMPKPGIDLAAAPAVGFVNHGAWLARCPQPDCHGAEYVDDRRASFFCCECRNAATGGVQIPLTMPSASARAGIESALLGRPDTKNRNWLVGESTANLVAENVAHGIGAHA